MLSKQQIIILIATLSSMVWCGCAYASNNQFCIQGLERGAEGKFDEARELLEKASAESLPCYEVTGGIEILSDVSTNKVKPKVAVILFRALIGSQNNDLQAMVAEAAAAITKAPNYAPAYSIRGGAKGLLGKPDEAIEDFTRSIKIEPENSSAFYGRGLAYKAEGNLELAMSDFRRAVELGHLDAYVGIGTIYGMKEEYELAFTNFNKVLEINPSNADALSGRAFLYSAKGDLVNASKDINKAIELDSQNPEIWFSKKMRNPKI